MNILTNNTHFPFKAHTFNKQPVTILNWVLLLTQEWKDIGLGQ
jgi:hypothetical protein